MLKEHFAWVLAVAVFVFVSATFSEAQTVWNSASDGTWSNAPMWSAGVPDQNAVFLTNTVGSYTVTVDTEPAAPFGNLAVVNAAGNTTRLNVDAAGFASTNGVLSFGKGAEVVVNSGGVMGYVGRTPATAPFVEVKNGGVWRVDGGTVDFSNLRRNTPTSGTSYIYIGNGSTGRMEVASGEIVFSGIAEDETNNTAIIRVGNSTGSHGELVMSGGKLTIYNQSPAWNQEGLNIGTGGTGARGAVSLSGDALLLVSNMLNVANTTLGTGTVDVAGSATLSMPRGNRFYVATSASALGVVTVRENGFLDLGGG